MQAPQRVIYLPPGVMPPVAPQQPPVQIPGVPFDRAFFEQVLPGAIQALCSQMHCDRPVVEVLTVDGATHFIKGISGVSDIWVALHTKAPEHDHDIQVFIPYQTIFRVTVHPCDDERRRLGFVLEPATISQATLLPAAPVAPPAEPEAAAARPAARKRSTAKS